MTFSPWQSRFGEDSIRIPAIGPELQVRLPNRVSGGTLEMIETIDAPNVEFLDPPLRKGP